MGSVGLYPSVHECVISITHEPFDIECSICALLGTSKRPHYKQIKAKAMTEIENTLVEKYALVFVCF